MKKYQFGDTDNDRQIALSIGDEFEVTLESAPSTGCRWSVSKTDAAVLRQLGEPHLTAPSRDGAPGSVGRETFRFRAQAAGELELALALRRVVDKASEPFRLYSLHIAVR